MSKANVAENKKLTINDTFSMEGSLLSTIPNNTKNTSVDYNNASKSLLFQNTNNSINNPTSNLKVNPIGSSNISDNLVSLLSDIIVESINNGNPTLKDLNNSKSSQDKNINVSLISGNWKLDVLKGNISNFQAKYDMVALNGVGYHRYLLNNLKSSEKLFFGNDDSIAINGKLDLYTENNSTKEIADVLFSINNLELIQIKFLDNASTNQINNYPLYGTIDSINIRN
ncbi:MAG: hypothetical protein ACTHKF_08950 [Candidatus Nitrosocosmicus sp.]